MSRTAKASWLALIVVATLGWYGWTATIASGEWPALRPKGHPETDHFNLLSHGFQQGHLYLDAEPPPGLAKLANPWDPAQRQREGIEVLHDASYFRGRYYIYFGPAPVVTLFLPFALLTGRDLPLAWAVWLYCSGGYLVLAATLLSWQRRHYPQASVWTCAAGLIALAGGALVTSLLRRPNVWELSAASGFFFFALSVFALLRSLEARHAPRWGLVAGLALGLAVASRPTYVLAAAMFAAPWCVDAWQRRRVRVPGPSDVRPATRSAWLTLLAAISGSGLCGVALAWYNYARFGSPFEFGQKYQLSAIFEGGARHFSLDHVWFNFRLYLLAPLRWQSTFPFHHGIAVPTAPPGHGGYEYAIGLWANVPFALLAFLAVARLLGWRRDMPVARTWTIGVVALLIAVSAQVALLLCYFGACLRYMVDFAPGCMLLAAIGVFEAEMRFRHRGTRTLLRFAAVTLAAASVFTATMAVVHLYSSPARLLKAYQPIARALNQPYFWWQARQLPRPRPVELTFTLPAERPRRREELVTLTRGSTELAAISIEYLDHERVQFAYTERTSGQHAPTAPVAVTIPPGTLQTLRLRLGGRFGDFDGEYSRLRGQLNGRPLWDAFVLSLPAFPARVRLISPAQFSGQLHSAHAIGEAMFAWPELGGARLRLKLDPVMAGRAFPLAVSGRAGAGDLLFLRVSANGDVTFGYDHWGDSVLRSPTLAVGFEQDHVVEFWTPALGGDLIVKLDGRVVWRQTAPAYPTTASTYFIATNPIGGTTCESVLENAVIEAQQLPLP